MQALAGIFFQMGAGQVHYLVVSLALGRLNANRDRAMLDHRQLELADLVALGQIGIEVVFARKDRFAIDVGADGQTKTNGFLHGGLVHHRQGARHGDIDHGGLRIGFSAKSRARRRENLGISRKLGVDLQPDHDFPLHRFNLNSGPAPAGLASRRNRLVHCSPSALLGGTG